MTRRTLLIAVLTGFGVVALALGVRSGRDVESPVQAQGVGAAAPATAPSANAGGQKLTIKFVKNPVPVPAFDGKDLSGKPISADALKGKVVLINFWATWCGPCRKEIPDLIALQEQFRDKLQVIGVSVDTPGSEEAVRAFTQQFKFNYPVMMGDINMQRRFGGITGIPATFIINPDGRMVQKHVGVPSAQMVETEVRALLGMPVDAIVEHVEDTGKIFTANATELPGLDLASLSPTQKAKALEKMKSETCGCGCGFNIAECRINDSNCAVSLPRGKAIVEEIKKGSGL